MIEIGKTYMFDLKGYCHSFGRGNSLEHFYRDHFDQDLRVIPCVTTSSFGLLRFKWVTPHTGTRLCNFFSENSEKIEPFLKKCYALQDLELLI